MGLATYKRKRNFQQTPEPAEGGKTGHGIFVVQLHHASHRHYDFRLEHGGTLKSWAVPKGPSFDPTVKRMAVEVEDHPVSYATFEGDIPAGNYGAGHVDVFDSGTWQPEGSVRSGLAKGELKFSLHGDILRGSWVLVRTRRNSGKPQWLLIKHRDSYAGPREADDFVDPHSDRPIPLHERKSVWKETTAAAQPRAAKENGKKSTRKTVSAVGQKAPLSTGAFAPQLCRVQEQAPAGDAWLHEAKWDGYRLVATVQRGKARLWSRNGIEWTDKVPGIAAALRALAPTSAQFDGELIALRKGRDNFNALQAALSAGDTSSLVLMLFDLPYLDGRSLRELPLLQRKAQLENLLQQRPQAPLRYSTHHRGDGPAVFAQAVRAGLEGIISKRADSPYRGERNGDWVKTKSRPSDEFVVVGYTQPRGSRVGIGALLLARAGAHGLEYAGRVGSGFGDALLRTLRKRLEALRVDTAPVETTLIEKPDLQRASWVCPELVVEIHHQGTGRQGLIRQGALKGLREETSPDDLRSATARTAKRSKPTAAPATTAGAPDAVRLTHPERSVFPADGITKQHVADYYAAVAPLLLAEIAGRPLSVLRCPDGIASTCFFQKHAGKGWGDRVHAVKVREKNASKDYLAVDDATGLLQLVQMNVIEFHPWGAQADDQEHADRIVFDLDPDASVPWREVKAAARTVRDVLDGVGLRAFLRTSGGKGLHLVVPLAPPAAWAQAKRFAQDLAVTLAAERPETFVSVAGKSKRKGRIFIDWLRNSRGATSVASYSLRARPGAPVAMPLEWNELARLRGGDAYTIATALQKIRRRKSDPWRALYGLRQSLPGTPRRSR
ncbi:ATP-dependent DNA ligase LigD phosphoesterase module /ATP-dependent DNA ligase LigD polymerase module [Tahibacter aquaticus]|uniref:DNA ligase (ATP) n=1 Tax=Tahibacter aquaticus TaxID=520092 RepID=A0A4R6YYJ8_9GAMM|nr:DNA ligase D [Tahibacter aquaticus]TDR44099.1 ATP-dependent DNA ligase LigD phosphoesterase module /ATP-dependent DNA ligase LigD polymerase module [Tahibacter aquaticus]